MTHNSEIVPPARRVSATLPGSLWGAFDRWAEVNGMTRSEALIEAVHRVVDEHESYMLGATQMGLAHPDLVGETRPTPPGDTA